MRKIYKFSLLSLFLLSFTNLLLAQNSFFQDAGENRTVQTSGDRVITPQKFRTSSLDVQAMKNFLWALPAESRVMFNRNNAPVLVLPMPDGSSARFHVWESSVQEPGLEAKFPEIKTFAGQGIDDPYATLRFDYNPYFGFSAQILSPNGRIFIDPYARRDVNNYISYYMRDYHGTTHFECGVIDEQVTTNSQNIVNAGPCLGTQLRTFRLAFSCTGEFAQAVGGGAAGPTHAAIVTGVNRLTQVYEDELAIRLVLIADNNLIEFLNPATDPWLNNGSIAELNAITGNINTALASVGGAAAYDIGHLGCTASNAGVAGLGVVCGASKGRGLTGGINPVGDPYYIDYVAHEMGHQFNAAHTFNSSQCASPGGSYEPGGGTTIMAYAGICAANENIQPNSDPIFHAFSFDQIGTFVSTGGGSSCPVVTPTGNTLPVATITTANNLSIPINTPFVLDATATDADGDPITYNWEGWDLGAAGTWTTAATSTTRPLFRTRLSKTNGQRTFPDIRVIAANYPGTTAPSAMDGLRGEVLPQVARAMKFRLTVRDNRAGGAGVVSAGDGCQNTTIFQVNAVGTTPFAVTAPNGGENYPGGTTQTITWNNAGTTAAPFNVANVRITLSTDGGLTYPTVISASTPNDGSESVTIPSVVSTTARIRIEAIGNIFFDISNANFTISVAPNGFTFNSPAAVTAACPAPNVMTSGNLTASYTGTFTGNINLTGTVAPAGPTVSFSNPTLTTGSPSSTVSLTGMSTLSPGNYVVTVTGTGVGGGNPVQTRDITFTINPGSGPTITTQPANQTTCAGTNATFSVTATGATGYQWQVATLGCAGTFTNISGATSSSYTVTAPTSGQNGYGYRCIVTGQCGTTTSSCASLTVNVAPVISSNPANIAVCSGSSASFSVTATGSGIGYQWEISSDGGTTWIPILGANAATYTVMTTTTAMNGDRFRCVVTGTCTPPATSSAAILTVNSSVTVTGNPANQTICEGTGTSFTAAASGTGLNYQWEVSTNGGTTWTNVVNNANYAGATTPTLTLTNVPPSFNNNRYRCNITSPPCTPGVTTAATLTVNTFPVIVNHPANLTICEGANSSFSVTATTGVGSLSYQWQFRTTPAGTWNNIAGATSATFSQNFVIGQNGYQFRVIVTAGCGSTPSNPATITVNAYPVATLTNLPTTVCLSDPDFTLTASTAGGAWNGPGVIGSTFSPAAAGIGTKTINYVLTNAGCVTTKTSIVQVNECAERQLRLYDALSFKVFPTPNDGNFNIRLNSDLYRNLGVRVFNSLGQQVHAQQFSGLTFGSVVSVDMTGIPKGVYQVFVYSTDLDKVDSRGVSIIVNY